MKDHPSEIGYEEAGFPLHVLFICTVSIADHEALIKETLDLAGIFNVRELMWAHQRQKSN